MLRGGLACVYVDENEGSRLKSRRRDILRLLNAHGTRLHGLLYRLTLQAETAEELLQDLVVRLMKSDRFPAARDPAAFAFRTAIHLAMDWRRRQKLRRAAGMNLEPAGVEVNALERLVKAEELAEIVEALEHVSESSREVFVMRLIEGRSYEEIAAMRGGTAHQARASCHRAVRQVRELVEARQEVRRD